MQLLKEPRFYSNIRTGLNEEDEDYRQLLRQQSKICLARARQFSQETNRRRKALEDRKRQQEIQEKRLRENILQQRKQRLQEVTERFQRAYLPPAQRRRPVSTTREPNLDEALLHIQGAQTSNPHHSSFLNGISTISSPFPQPPGDSSGPRSQHPVSATQANTKLKQERNLDNFKTSQHLFNHLQEDLHKVQEQFQDQSGIPVHHEESLYSLDSLENEVTSSPSTVEDESEEEVQHVQYFLKAKEQGDITGQQYNSNITMKSNVQYQRKILKKRSNRLSVGETKFSYTSAHFSSHMAVAIRDSLNLSRLKGRDSKNKCIQKKIRWLDKVNIEQPLLEQQQESSYSCYMNTPSRIPKSYKTFSGPAEPNSAKQAWLDVPQKGKQQESTARLEKSASGLWVPQQAHSTRTGSGNISSRVRRGTMIRPLSSSQHLARAQGMVLGPQPPPRSEVTGENLDQKQNRHKDKTGTNDECSQGKAHRPMEQILHKDYPEGQHVHQHHVVTRDECSILAPFPLSSACMYETVTQGIYTLCQADGQVDSGSNSLEAGDLDRTPSDEEISLLKGVCCALASKNDDSQRPHTHKGLLSALPQTRANLSRAATNSDSLFSGDKSVPRMGGFHLSSSNARSPVRRPTLENNVVKNRTVGNYRKPPVFYQATVPKTASKTDQMAHDQVSEVIGGNHQVAVDSAPYQRAAKFLHSQRGLSALSLEEQKVLQSLDRLNHHLQYVQDVAAANTTLKGFVGLDPAYNQTPRPGECSRAIPRSYYGGSADNCTRPHRS